MAEETPLSPASKKFVISNFTQAVKLLEEVEGHVAAVRARVLNLSTEDVVRLALRYTRSLGTDRTIDGEGAFAQLSRLSEQDVWGSDDDYPRHEWQHAVGDNDTNLGYWDWVQARKDRKDRAVEEAEEAEGNAE